MALWKPFLGNRTALDTVEKHAGYVYWCSDDGSLHFDYEDADGNLQRKQINAKDCETILGVSLEEIKKSINYNDLLNAPTLGTLASKNEVAKSDLASDVQKSLSKADSAIQEHQSLAGLATEKYVENKISSIPTPDVSGQIDAHNTSDTAHADIRTVIGELEDTIDNITVPTVLSDLADDATHRTVTDAEKSTWNSKANKSDIPTKVSDLTNDSGFITGYTETDPTVPAWAKASTKPSYTAAEVGADSSGTATSVVSIHNSDNAAHSDIRAAIPDSLADLSTDSTHRVVTDTEKSTWNAKANTSDIPTKVSDLTNDSGFITGYTETDPTVPSWAKASTKPNYTKSEVGLGNVDDVKQYSANNPPPYPITKINGKTGEVTLSASDVGALPNTTAIPTVPTKVSAFTNDAGYLTDVPDEIYVGDGTMPDGATIQILMDGSDEEQALMDELKDYIDGEIEKVTPVKGVDYYTEADRAEIVAAVIESLGGNPIFGIVDENNNIIVNGVLPDGTYTVKYEMEGGKIINIGNLVLDSNVYYTVTKNLTNCNISNSATQAVQGGSYSATITANDGFELKSVSVTMGGSPVTVTGGNISIANVTGDIVITAVAEEATVAINNLAQPDATATGEAAWNSGGWCNNSYMEGSSYAYRSATDGRLTTNTIAVEHGDTIYIKGIKYTEDSTVQIALFDANSSYIKHGAAYTNVLANGYIKNLTGTVGEDYWHFDNAGSGNSDQGTRFVRFAGYPSGDISDIIITRNQPIE